MFHILGPFHLRNAEISQEKTMLTLYNLEQYSLSSWWIFCTHFAISSPPLINNYLRFSVEGFGKNTNLLIDSHFIKNNHLAIWPMVNNNKKKKYNITGSTHWAHSIYQALCFLTLSHNPHKLAKYNSKKETQMYLLKIIQLINGRIRNQNQDCMTPKSSAFYTPPGYLHNTRLEIRPVTYQTCVLELVTTSLSQFSHLQDKRISVADLQRVPSIADILELWFITISTLPNLLYTFLNRTSEAIQVIGK